MANSSRSYQSKAGDLIDDIAFRYYGKTSGGEVEAIYAANNHLADYGPELPAGLVIVLPEVQSPRKDTTLLFS
jgi:phage tail protein X